MRFDEILLLVNGILALPKKILLFCPYDEKLFPKEHRRYQLYQLAA